jgi:hypothetical protein
MLPRQHPIDGVDIREVAQGSAEPDRLRPQKGILFSGDIRSNKE